MQKKKKNVVMTYHTKMTLYALKEHCTHTADDLRYAQPHNTGNDM